MPTSNEKFQNAKDFYLIGADLSLMDLSGKDFTGTTFINCNMRSAICVGTNFTRCDMRKADMSSAILRLADFTDANLSGADMSMTYAKAALFLRTKMRNTIIRHAIWKNALVIDADMVGADVVGTLLLGARFDGTDTRDMRNADRAVFAWWISPWGGPPSYDPIPGWLRLDHSIPGGESFRENAARDQQFDPTMRGEL
jgi:uncharacterized protein YjbI with pentapeptide repeats